jgi:rubrerythrin
MSALPEKVEKLLVIFNQAIEAEKAAQETYRRARDLCEDGMLKEILEGFRKDEERHERELIARYNKIRAELDEK